MYNPTTQAQLEEYLPCVRTSPMDGKDPMGNSSMKSNSNAKGYQTTSRQFGNREKKKESARWVCGCTPYYLRLGAQAAMLKGSRLRERIFKSQHRRCRNPLAPTFCRIRNKTSALGSSNTLLSLRVGLGLRKESALSQRLRRSMFV